jgi:hypothetical protein
MPEDKPNDEAKALEEQKAKIKAESEKLNAEKISHKREVLVDLGYDAEEAKKITSIEVLNFAIDTQRKMKKEEVEPEKPKLMKMNASSAPQIQLPSGETLEADPVEQRFNEANPEAHILDPNHSPLQVVLFRSNCRVNPLPADKNHPYEQVI